MLGLVPMRKHALDDKNQNQTLRSEVHPAQRLAGVAAQEVLDLCDFS